MSRRPEPVSSASSRSAPGGDPLARLERAGHALPQAGQDPARRAADEQDLRALDATGRHRRRGTSSSRRGRGGTGSCGRTFRFGYDRRDRGAARDASGRGRRRRAATPRSAAGRRAGGPAGTARSRGRRRSVPTRSIRRWLWAILRRSVGSVRVRRAGDAGHDRRRIRREAARGCQPGREAQAGTRPRRRARSPGRRSSPPRRPGPRRVSSEAVSTNAARAVGQGAELRHDPVRAAGAGTLPHLAPDADELARRRSPARPPRCRVRPARRASTQVADGQAQSRSKRSTGRTNTVAPPTSTSSG